MTTSSTITATHADLYRYIALNRPESIEIDGQRYERKSHRLGYRYVNADMPEDWFDAPRRRPAQLHWRRA